MFSQQDIIQEDNNPVKEFVASEEKKSAENKLNFQKPEIWFKRQASVGRMRPRSPRRWSAAGWGPAPPGWGPSRWPRASPAGCS